MTKEYRKEQKQKTSRRQRREQRTAENERKRAENWAKYQAYRREYENEE